MELFHHCSRKLWVLQGECMILIWIASSSLFQDVHFQALQLHPHFMHCIFILVSWTSSSSSLHELIYSVETCAAWCPLIKENICCDGCGTNFDLCSPWEQVRRCGQYAEHKKTCGQAVIPRKPSTKLWVCIFSMKPAFSWIKAHPRCAKTQGPITPLSPCYSILYHTRGLSVRIHLSDKVVQRSSGVSKPLETQQVVGRKSHDCSIL